MSGGELASRYLAKYYQFEAGNPGAGESRILDFFGSLDLIDWQQLLHDLCTQGAGAIDVFRPASIEYLIPSAQALLSKMSLKTKGLAGQALKRLISLAAVNRGVFVEEVVIDMLSFVSCLASVSESLIPLVRDATLPRSIRVEAARALANAEETPDSFWLDLDYSAIPEIVPLMVVVIGPTAPFKGLEVLASLEDPPCASEELEYPISAAISALLEKLGGGVLLADWIMRLPNWLVPVVLRVIEEHPARESLSLREKDSVSRALLRVLSSVKGGPWEIEVDDILSDPLLGISGDGGPAQNVELLLERWSPWSEKGGVTLFSIIEVFKMFPSRGSFAALVSIASLYVRKVRIGPPKVDEISSLVRTLEALIGQVHIAHIGRAKEERLWFSFERLLVEALELVETASLVFDFLVKGEAEADVLSRYILKAMESGAMTAEECRVQLLGVRGHEYTDAVFLTLADQVQRRFGSADHTSDRLSVSLQLYDCSPQYLGATSLGLSDRELIKIQSRSRGVADLIDEDPGELVEMPSVESFETAG